MCHGFAASVLGDKTAKYAGRLTISPMSHIDPIGAVCLFLFGFGWAKPVPVNARNFKNIKSGMVITALAGPLSNFILAFISVIIAVAAGKLPGTDITAAGISTVVIMTLMYLAIINIGLGVFNLIPVPPLDGSKVLNALLPARIYFKIMQYERFGFIILILLINLPIFGNILVAVRSGILDFYFTIAGMIFG